MRSTISNNIHRQTNLVVLVLPEQQEVITEPSPVLYSQNLRVSHPQPTFIQLEIPS
jgi:hypothetical protein